MNDAEFMLSVLRDGNPHSTMSIIQRSIAERGCGLTPHSRAADLREQGHEIVCGRHDPRPAAFPRRAGRPTYFYRLVLEETEGDPLSSVQTPSVSSSTGSAAADKAGASAGPDASMSATASQVGSPPPCDAAAEQLELREDKLRESTRDLDEAFFYGAPDEVIADGVTEEMASFGGPA